MYDLFPGGKGWAAVERPRHEIIFLTFPQQGKGSGSGGQEPKAEGLGWIWVMGWNRVTLEPRRSSRAALVRSGMGKLDTG